MCFCVFGNIENVIRLILMHVNRFFFNILYYNEKKSHQNQLETAVYII